MMPPTNVRPIDVREPIPDHQPDGGQSDPAIVGGMMQRVSTKQNMDAI
jgi:hypothetical protein